MITIIHPSRSRPSQAYNTALTWIKKIGLPDSEFEYILSVDNDDPYRWDYKWVLPITNFTTFRGDNRSAIDAVNMPARFYSSYRGKPGDFLIVISDDFECLADWGTSLKIALENKEDFLIKTWDGIQPWIVTLPIMDWTFYSRIGHVYHQDYKHCFCDTELTCIGELTRRMLTIDIQGFRHNHYSVGGTVKDEVSEKADTTFEEGKKIFIQRKAKNFDLKLMDLRGILPDNVYTRMK